MLNDIINYIKYLNSYHDLSISIHNRNSSSNHIICKLTPYNIHRNPYCLYIKSDIDRHRQCIQFQQEVRGICDKAVLCTTCMCGVKEYIVPIKYDADFLGFICAGGYKGDRDKCVSYACRNNLSAEELMNKYDKYLKDNKPDENMIRTLVKPLAAMLALTLTQNGGQNEESDDTLYKHILSVIHAGAFEKLSIEDIAKACHCSQSMASHLFKKKSGTTINRYLTDLRMKKAENMLCQTNLSITDIAYSCGFSDANYFIYAFGKKHGIPPLKYRKYKIRQIPGIF